MTGKKLMPTITVFLIFLFCLHMSSATFAVCPVCTVAVGAGIGVSRLLGIDDIITGIWVGGLILSSALWLSDAIAKSRWKIPFPSVTSTILMLFLVLLPMYLSKTIGTEENTFFGIDKILFGCAIGFLLFLVSVNLDKWFRRMNQGHVYIYYQKVIIPVFLLSVASFLVYLLI